MSTPSYKIPPQMQRLFLTIRNVLIVTPPDLILTRFEEEFLGRLALVLREMNPFLRRLLYFGLWIFAHMPWIFGRGFTGFLRMSEEKKRRYISFWENTHNALFRNFFKGVRTIIMLSYFSHPDLWNYIGYKPAEHVQERVRLRESLLSQDVKEETLKS